MSGNRAMRLWALCNISHTDLGGYTLRHTYERKSVHGQFTVLGGIRWNILIWEACNFSPTQAQATVLGG